MPYRLALVTLLFLTAACDTGSEEPAAPVLSECAISASEIAPGETVTFGATLNTNAQEPLLVSIDWGDGSRDDVTRFPVTHTYTLPGAFTPRATAINSLGDDSCQDAIVVSNPLCQNVALGPIFFAFGSSAVEEDGLAILQRGSLVLRSCTELCLAVDAFTDDLETDQMPLSQARANAVRDFYLSDGVAATRVEARGLGEAAGSDSEGTLGEGDFRARRAESTVGLCAL